ncbi:uncharacterized protein LOC126975307 [Leptidea sinapis]|uniref:uncharacterized protein LOC126975307 n=1 Tax=Leptidea sinapis TaxID=189913 RepID=UPI0021C42CE2|nr:uncharacterized protein LOC126975307 [Leptidea sinapis]
MRRLIFFAALCALVWARPETYKETEDFQYSRSSSDEGHKAGYYGAQRGNMGGNYEKAHNMDSLAQHHMSSAVRQVEGELGDGANTKTGSVYTAANSRGIFGSGNYDLSNLKGRNFDEAQNSFDSQAQSSLRSHKGAYTGQLLKYSGTKNAGYTSGFSNSHGQSYGYQSAAHSEQYSENQSAHTESTLSADNQYIYGGSSGVGREHQYGYDSSNLRTEYDSSGKRLSGTPYKVYMRPGTIVTIPVSAKTYDASHIDTAYDRNSHSEAEILNGRDQTIYVPVGKPKHYESSYKYKKEWERHDTQPVTIIPTENPFPKNSELYDDSLLLHNAKGQFNTVGSNHAYSGNVNSAQSSSFRSDTKSSSNNRSKYGYGFNSQALNTNRDAQLDAYTLGSQASGSDLEANSLVENINSKPKSYQSSYSYHKAWERQGDPYVIKPVGGSYNDESSRLVDTSALKTGHSSHQYGSQYKQAHHSYYKDGVEHDCDEHGNIRVARSYNPDDYYQNFGKETQSMNLEDFNQHAQNLEHEGQQKWDNYEDLGQQTQNSWRDSQHLDQQMQDFSQQTQNLEQGLHGKWEKYEDLGQQTQNKWDNLESFIPQTQRKS